jgi:gluconate 2-dehydrogenase gamma chain
MSVSRRDLLRSLSLSAAAGSVLYLVPLADAEKAHRMASTEKAASASGNYTAKFFSAHQYQTPRALCEVIIPPDHESGGALEAGAPEFIDLLTRENKDLQLQLGGGIMWLDSTCPERYGQTYLKSTPIQQKEILDLIAFRKNADVHPRLSPGIEFFATVRKFAVDGFFTSEIGIKYLGYIGNTYRREFPGCPEIPEA